MAVANASMTAITTSRPIDRLPVRRLSNEPREAMNCKSCRKRKIKCNRLRPSCEACQVFNCACVYDAQPKKRGPKTDVLEALLKRVNGLEKRLKEENKSTSPDDQEVAAASERSKEEAEPVASVVKKRSSNVETPTISQPAPLATTSGPQQPRLGFADSIPRYDQSLQQDLGVRNNDHGRPQQASALQNSNALLDVYFARLHGKPYYILDEAATRQKWQAGLLPMPIASAIHAVTARYAPHLVGGHNAAVRVSDDCSTRARMALDSDEPTVENLQASLLLSNAFFQAGKGKKSYMLLSNAVSMALALGLHRELPATLRISPAEREGRRRLFWTCYLMDRFTATGSKRPSLIADESIGLRLPAWPADGSSVPYEGAYFSDGTNMPLTAGPGGRIGQSTGAMLIEIVRILGTTNRYLAAGGVKGDSHFPWHAQSNLSRVRQDLDFWASNNQDAFLSLDSLFGQAESSILVLSKLIYHLVHCLIYRPFLPVDLTELAGTGQHQSWQIEATNLCFLNANAITELVEIGRASSIVDWPAFVGYCLCTAGTIHVHGAHYIGREGDLFARSADFLSREMTQLSEMRVYYAGIQHQRETLQTVYGCHSQLVKSLASNPMRFSPVFQMEDFFDRYPAQFIDGAHVTFSDIRVESMHETLPAYEGLNGNNNDWTWTEHVENGISTIMPPPLRSPHTNGKAPTGQPKKKRRRTTDDNTKSPTNISPTTNEQHIGHPSSTLPPTSDPSTTSNPPQGIPDQHPHPNNQLDPQAFTQNPLSPSFSFSPWPSLQQIDMNQAPSLSWDLHNTFSMRPITDQQTPDGLSVNGSVHTADGEKDPFLTLLEQLAENESSQAGGPSDLDFFLSGQG